MISGLSCDGVAELEALISGVLIRLREHEEFIIQKTEIVRKESGGLLDNANSFWLIPLSAIAGNMIASSTMMEVIKRILIIRIIMIISRDGTFQFLQERPGHSDLNE